MAARCQSRQRYGDRSGKNRGPQSRNEVCAVAEIKNKLIAGPCSLALQTAGYSERTLPDLPICCRRRRPARVDKYEPSFRPVANRPQQRLRQIGRLLVIEGRAMHYGQGGHGKLWI